MADTRKPVIPPHRNPPIKRTAYYPQDEVGRFSRGSSGTLISNGGAPNTARLSLTVSRPTVVIFHSSNSQAAVSTGTNDSLTAYYSLEVPDAPFAPDPGLPVLPLIAGRIAFLHAPGRWIIDWTTGSAGTNPIDYDVFYFDNLDVARSWISWVSDRNQPSSFQQATHATLPAATETTIVTFEVCLLSRALYIQKETAVNTLRINIGNHATATTGYLLTDANPILDLSGHRMMFGAVNAFAVGGAVDYTLITYGPGWRTY